MKRLLPYATLGVLAASTFSCRSNPEPDTRVSLIDNYTTTLVLQQRVHFLADAHAGKLTISKTPEGKFTYDGSFKLKSNLPLFEKSLRTLVVDADDDDDYYINSKEFDKAEQKVFRKQEALARKQ